MTAKGNTNLLSTTTGAKYVCCTTGGGRLTYITTKLKSGTKQNGTVSPYGEEYVIITDGNGTLR